MKINHITIEIPRLHAQAVIEKEGNWWIITMHHSKDWNIEACLLMQEAGDEAKAQRDSEEFPLETLGLLTKKLEAKGLGFAVEIVLERGELKQQTYDYILGLFDRVEEEKPSSANATYTLGWARCMDKFQ